MGNACDVIPLKRYFFRCGKSGEIGNEENGNRLYGNFIAEDYRLGKFT